MERDILNKDVIKELNNFLQGQYMGIHEYERLIKHTNDPEVKEELQKIQQEHKLHAIMVAERIQNLGGSAVDDVGIKGAMVETMNWVKGTSNQVQHIIDEAVRGESMGIRSSEELVKGDLDEDSRKLIEDILDTDRGHIEHLNNLLN